MVHQDGFLMRAEANSQLRYCSPKGSDSGTQKNCYSVFKSYPSSFLFLSNNPTSIGPLGSVLVHLVPGNCNDDVEELI